MPIEIPIGPGGADRGKPEVPGDPCFLCEVIAGRSEKGMVEETELTLTLVNWAQFELGQVYVVPRRHAPTLFDLTNDETVAVIHAARRVADAIVRAYDPDGLNPELIAGQRTMVVIAGPPHLAVQKAPHFHMHVVPRRKGRRQRLGQRPSPPSRDWRERLLLDLNAT